jgi:hypothetical protein
MKDLNRRTVDVSRRGDRCAERQARMERDFRRLQCRRGDALLQIGESAGAHSALPKYAKPEKQVGIGHSTDSRKEWELLPLDVMLRDSKAGEPVLLVCTVTDALTRRIASWTLLGGHHD